ncbi:MAG TPA: glycosyltransferase family 39 protein [Bryobacteraceae bacterium]|nr:glycosyltransferase family 39 protein [Bryobacteraceae bacterium]
MVSDRWLTVLEDEVSIVTMARQPVSKTLAVFTTGPGQHEHPPLSDLVLHLWLPIGGWAPWALRLPSIVYYLAGLLVLASVARKLAGDSAFMALLWMGCLWPFGFHFGRLIGWYSFCFLLTAIITWTYVRYVESPVLKNWIPLVIASLMLVYSNYYGWVVISCIGVDMLRRRPTWATVRLLAVSLAVLATAYIPMITAARNMAQRDLPSVLHRVVLAAYHFFTLFVSESIAPWFWPASIPVSIAIVVAGLGMLVLLPKQHYSFLLYFLALFSGLAIIGALTVKRLLFLSGWLLLPMAIAVTVQGHARVRRLVFASLATIAAFGWFGIVTRSHYASTHFIEPWESVGQQAAEAVKAGGIVLTNSPSFRFYVNYAMHRAGMLPSSAEPGAVNDPRIHNIEDWEPSRISGVSDLLFVKGANVNMFDVTNRSEELLKSRCKLLSTTDMVPDSGYDFKARMGFTGQIPYRVSLQRFSCAGK